MLARVDNVADTYFGQTAGNLNSGGGNTAFGFQALHAGASVFNTAIGSQTMALTTTGQQNVARAMRRCTTTSAATITRRWGAQALFYNTNGSQNSAVGYQALFNNTRASIILDWDIGRCIHNTSGSQNIGIGYYAGGNVTTGSNNIIIGNAGQGADDSVIRIGQGQTKTFIMGIYGIAVSGSAVTVNAGGQLGVAPSSKRFKQDIEPMEDASEKLLALRPVKFRYKPEIDPKGTGAIRIGGGGEWTRWTRTWWRGMRRTRFSRCAMTR